MRNHGQVRWGVGASGGHGRRSDPRLCLERRGPGRGGGPPPIPASAKVTVSATAVQVADNTSGSPP